MLQDIPIGQRRSHSALSMKTALIYANPVSNEDVWHPGPKIESSATMVRFLYATNTFLQELKFSFIVHREPCSYNSYIWDISSTL